MDYKQIDGLQFHQKGKYPQLLIQSGTHGHEFHVIDPLTQVVTELYDELSDFMFIPAVSPSAVAKQTRKNKYGHDINRDFGTLSDPEAIANKNLLKTLMGTTVISFHEDEENDSFYFYDTQTLDSRVLDAMRKNISDLDIPLFDGIDDPKDPALAYKITNGYANNIGIPSKKGSFIEEWGMHYGYISRFITFEVPYKHKNLMPLLRLCVRFGIELTQFSLPAY